MFWNFQTSGNSRGQRMVDPMIMYENYDKPIKTRVVNLIDKQLVFPVDDDNDIIIVNEDYSPNSIEIDQFKEVGEEEIGDSKQASEER